MFYRHFNWQFFAVTVMFDDMFDESVHANAWTWHVWELAYQYIKRIALKTA